MTNSKDMTFKDFMEGGQLNELAPAVLPIAKAVVGGVTSVAGALSKKKKPQPQPTETSTQTTVDEAKALDPSLAGGASIRQTGAGGRKYPERKKSEGERTRMKAVGGGKQVPAASYKDRKDIGATKARSEVEQQPEKPRGDVGVKQTYADKVKAERKAAALARRAAKGGGEPAKKERSKETEKKATELLKKKTTKSVSPDYKPQAASGKTRAERDKIRGDGERMLKGIMKTQETERYKKTTGQNPDAKGRQKILGRVNARMSK